MLYYNIKLKRIVRQYSPATQSHICILQRVFLCISANQVNWAAAYEGKPISVGSLCPLERPYFNLDQWTTHCSTGCTSFMLKHHQNQSLTESWICPLLKGCCKCMAWAKYQKSFDFEQNFLSKCPAFYIFSKTLSPEKSKFIFLASRSSTKLVVNSIAVL